MRLFVIAMAMAAFAGLPAAAEDSDWVTAQDMVSDCRAGAAPDQALCRNLIHLSVLILQTRPGPRLCAPPIDKNLGEAEQAARIQANLVDPILGWIETQPQLLKDDWAKGLYAAPYALWSC